MISEKLLMDDYLMLERMGVSAKSYIADTDGISYDENDVGKDTLFLRTLYFNTKFASNSVLMEWMDFLKKSIYINMFGKTIVSYGNAEVSVACYLDKTGCGEINKFFDEYNFEQKIEYEHSSKGNGFHLIMGSDENEKGIFFKRKGIEAPIPFVEESLGNQNLLNNTILRPDQEYSVEFQHEQGSSVKRFSSEQSRSAQNIEKMYVSGGFGGLPEHKEIEKEDKQG